MRCSATRTRFVFKPTAEPHRHWWSSIRATMIAPAFPNHFHTLYLFSFWFWPFDYVAYTVYRETVGCCKLGHPHPIVVGRARRALQSRALCRLRLQHDSEGAIECLRRYLGVKAVFRVLRGKRCGSMATFKFRFLLWVQPESFIKSNLMYLNLHFETRFFPHAWVCHALGRGGPCQRGNAADLNTKSCLFAICGVNPSLFPLRKIYSLGLLYLIIQEITMGPPSPLQSPARSSQTWSTRFSLTRNLTPRSSENAPPRSVRWTEKTAQRQTKKRKRRSRLWSTAWPVRGGAVIITPGFLI